MFPCRTHAGGCRVSARVDRHASPKKKTRPILVKEYCAWRNVEFWQLSRSQNNADTLFKLSISKWIGRQNTRSLKIAILASCSICEKASGECVRVCVCDKNTISQQKKVLSRTSSIPHFCSHQNWFLTNFDDTCEKNFLESACITVSFVRILWEGNEDLINQPKSESSELEKKGSNSKHKEAATTV